MLDTPLNLQAEVVFLNNYKGPQSDLINTVILITKQHIYATKCLKQQLISMNLTQKIHDMQNLERIVAREGTTTEFH